MNNLTELIYAKRLQESGDLSIGETVMANGKMFLMSQTVYIQIGGIQ
jgi:hypothetical protein